MITKIRKRDGRLVDYDISKIENAIAKAMMSLGDGEIKDCKKMAKITELYLTEKFEDKIPSVEDIQDIVENVLMRNGYEDVAKAYIIYRRDHEKIRNINNTFLDYKQTVDKYLKLADWRVKENSTVTYSVGGLILSNSGAITANYWLSDVYDKDIEQAHKNADIHIHDLSMLTGYCAGWSLKQLIQEGLGGVPGKITSSPASHLSTLCNQMVNFLGII